MEVVWPLFSHRRHFSLTYLFDGPPPLSACPSPFDWPAGIMEEEEANGAGRRVKTETRNCLALTIPVKGTLFILIPFFSRISSIRALLQLFACYRTLRKRLWGALETVSCFSLLLCLIISSVLLIVSVSAVAPQKKAPNWRTRSQEWPLARATFWANMTSFVAFRNQNTIFLAPRSSIDEPAEGEKEEMQRDE